MFQKRISSVSPSCQPLLSPALLQSYVDGSVRDVLLCSGLCGNMRCRKGSPCSTRAKGIMRPRLASLHLVRLCLPRFRSARHCFRDLPMTLDRFCRYSLPLAFCAENAALAFRTPPLHAALPCCGGGVISALDARKPCSARQRARPLRGRHPVGLHGSLALAPSAVKTVSTLFYNRANTVSLFTLFEKYCISFVQQMYYMYIIKTYGHAHVHYMFTEIAA